MIILVTAERVANDIARRVEIRKSILLHLLSEEMTGVLDVELSAEVPFAFVRRVITGLAQHVTDSRDLGR